MNENDMFTTGTSIYIQLYEKLRDDIVSGIYNFGQKFPSKRTLADRYGISLVSVEHSLELLCDEGYLESKERSGFTVIYRESDFVSTLPVNTEHKITSENQHAEKQNNQPVTEQTLPITMFPFSAYSRIMRKVISDYGETLLERVPGQGISRLREAVSSYLARSRGIRISPDRIVIGAGSEYLYGLIVQLFGRDAVFGIENPSYSKIEKVYRSMGARLEMLTLGTEGITSNALSGCNANILHITPYRSFPSGISTNASKRREYIRWADEHNAWIVEDDFESEFTTSSKPEETVFSLSDLDNVLYLNSFTRTISPSTRISYMILPQALTSVFKEKLGFYACTVPSFDQYVLAEFIESGEFERHINRVRRRLRSN